MYQNIEENKLQVLATNPLWINNQGKLHQVTNKYSFENVIRLQHCDGSHADYKIGKNFTMIPEFGIILFKDANEAVKYTALLDSSDGQSRVFKFYLEQNLETDDVCLIVDDEAFTLEPGLYSLKDLDQEMAPEVAQQLQELRFLNTYEVYNSKCKKIKVIENNDANKDIVELFFNSAQKHFKLAELQEGQTCNDCRVIFEVHADGNGLKRISAFTIHCFNIGRPYGFIRFSYLNGYPVLIDQTSAVNFRQYVRLGKTPIELTFTERLNQSTSAYNRRVKAADRRNKVIEAGKFCLNNWQYAVKGVSWAAGKLGIGGGKGGGGSSSSAPTVK